MKLHYAIATLAVWTVIIDARSALPHSLESLQQELFEKEKYFEIKDAVPLELALENADGKLISFTDLRGKVIVLHFIYTRCPDVCPLHSEKIADIQKMINITPMKEQVEFISITTDPGNDTPGVLRSYGGLHGLDSTNWLFLTKRKSDPEDATRKLAEKFGHGFDKTKDGMQMHGMVTHIIDQNGRWRANFHGLQFESLNLVQFINGLINVEIPHHQSGHQGNKSLWERLWSWFDGA
jgi:protein SCO1/2